MTFHIHSFKTGKRDSFTLIELLIVVAIIAILAAIAVPNYLEAQTRAKVSRVKEDLRTAATALESYAVDWNAYPMNDGIYNNLPLEITTPVAYLHNQRMVDPFTERELHPSFGELERFYTYTEIVDFDTAAERSQIGRAVPIEGINHKWFNLGAFEKYGKWRLVSNGPDRSYPLPGWIPGSDPCDPNDILMGIDVVYDPTNGTISGGNILRTQLDGDCKIINCMI